MQEQQEDLSGLSRNQNIDKPKHQGNINTDGKSQEIMHMHYNLIYKMATTNGRMLLIWRLNKSRNIRYSKILGRLSMKRTKLPMHQRDTKRSEYTLSLMSSIVEIQSKTCSRWTSHQGTYGNSLLRSCLYQKPQTCNVPCRTQ